jgi:hypothetical protein
MLGLPCLGQEVVIKVQPVVEGRSIEIGTGFGLDGDSVSISQLRFYLSEVTFLNDQDTIWTEPEIYRLLNLSDTSTLSFSAYVPHPNRFDAVRFRLGVDSISSSTGAHTGALDPANGMYWAWHTGYVNLKLEGNCNSCPGPPKTFNLHIGGFQSPFDAEREVTLYTADRYVNIYFDIGLILKAAFSNHQYQIMTPGEKAMRIADAAAKAFHLR